MIDIEKTISLRGYDPLMLGRGSVKQVWAICNVCGCGRWVVYQSCTDLCGGCSQKLRWSLPIPKFVPGEDRFIPGTGIDRIITIQERGYDPADLSHGSDKKVWCICEDCGEGRWVYMYVYSDVCVVCGIRRGLSPPKPKFVPEEDRFISETGIDRITTIEKMGYDPIDLSYGSNRKVWCICQKCENGRWLSMDTYNDLCSTCGNTRNGDSNPMWQGGISFEPYCPKFTEEVKQQVRNQYSNCDFISGLPENICNVLNGKIYKLDVHHVDSNKMQGCYDVKWQLVPLSRSNHMRMNANRGFWERLICYALEYDKTYYNEEMR